MAGWQELTETEQRAVVQAARRGQRGRLTAAEARHALDYAAMLHRAGAAGALGAIVRGEVDLWLSGQGVHRVTRESVA